MNYWSKFIPSLAELKFPLNQILRSQIFSWDEGADLAWNRIKALIALDICLTVRLQNEKLLVTTDASKIPSKRVMSSPLEHKTIFFSEFRLGDLMLYVVTKFN